MDLLVMDGSSQCWSCDVAGIHNMWILWKGSDEMDLGWLMWTDWNVFLSLFCVSTTREHRLPLLPYMPFNRFGVFMPQVTLPDSKSN